MNTFAIGSLPVHFSVAKLFNFRWQYTLQEWKYLCHRLRHTNQHSGNERRRNQGINKLRGISKLASEPTSATPFVHQSRNTDSQKKLILRLARRLGRLACRRSLGAFL